MTTSIDNMQVHSLLGKGGYAKVYLASGEEGNVAVKVMKPGALLDPEKFKEMIQDEFGTMQKVQHPNVIRVFKASDCGVLTKTTGEQKEVYYVTMELGSNGLVFDYLSKILFVNFTFTNL